MILLLVEYRAQNTCGLRAISPQFSQNSPREQNLVNGKMHHEGFFLKDFVENSPRSQKNILTPG